jgi:hypothetical protein
MPHAPQKGSIHYFDAIFPGPSQRVVAGSSSVQSAAALPGHAIVRLFSTVNCFLAIGPNPSAMADGVCVFLPSGIVEYFGIHERDKVAVIKDIGEPDGFLFITEGN